MSKFTDMIKIVVLLIAVVSVVLITNHVDNDNNVNTTQQPDNIVQYPAQDCVFVQQHMELWCIDNVKN